jgi:hypothetical protein
LAAGWGSARHWMSALYDAKVVWHLLILTQNLFFSLFICCVFVVYLLFICCLFAVYLLLLTMARDQVVNRLILTGLGLKALPWEVMMLLGVCRAELVTRHTSHITHHTSHITPRSCCSTTISSY